MKIAKKIAICFLIGIVCLAVNQPVMAGKGKININTATKAELVELKYIGDKNAEKIIEYRKAHPFEKPSDITHVKGIGNKAFEANKDRIAVSDE